MDLRMRNRITTGLNRINANFNALVSDRDRFLKDFEAWTEHRRHTLLELEKFQKELDRIHQCSNTGRAVGNGASVLGSLAAVVGFGLSFSKDLKPIGNELMKYGSAINAVGSVTTVSSSLIEVGFNAKVLNGVKAALKKDNQLTKELLPWFERTKELDSALKEVFGCSLTNGMSQILTLIYEVYSICLSGGETWDRLQGYLLSQAGRAFTTNGLQTLDNKKIEKILCNVSYKVQQLLVQFCHDPAVRKATWRIFETFKQNPISFDLSKISIRIVRKLSVQNSAGALTTSLTPAIGMQAAISSGTLALQGIFKTASFALSVLAFISTVDDIKQGRSKYDAMIEGVKKGLEEELAALESYPMLRR